MASSEQLRAAVRTEVGGSDCGGAQPSASATAQAKSTWRTRSPGTNVSSYTTAPGSGRPASSSTRARNCCTEPQATSAAATARALLRAITRVLSRLRVERNERALVDGGEAVDDVPSRQLPLLVMRVDRVHVVAYGTVLVVEARLAQRRLVLLVASAVVHEQLLPVPPHHRLPVVADHPVEEPRRGVLLHQHQHRDARGHPELEQLERPA